MPTSLFAPSQNDVFLRDAQQNCWLFFHRPLAVIAAQQAADVLPALREIETQVRQNGRYAAGFLSYEAAPAMDDALRVKTPGAGLPLLWFGIYTPPERLALPVFPGEAARFSGPWEPTTGEDAYHRAIHQIKEYIARGDTYQVNYTYRLRAEGSPPAWPLFVELAGAHNAPYAAFLETADWAICSISPELFFTLRGETVTTRPMKGTAPRGRWSEEDRQMAAWLQQSEKNRAENLMIVDMARNDLGRVARTGSVRVPALFQVEKYPTVWQMTSTVQAESSAGLVEIMQSLFPAASITGAPKNRTMQIIAELETTPRQVYTGAIGYFAPGRVAQFNVAIRTLWTDKQRRAAEYGVGGGIVWDSQAADEWAETQTKARVLTERPQPFELLETVRWTPAEGWFLLDRHLERLQSSADYFDFPLDLAALRRQLERAAAGFSEPQRVRLLLSCSGQCTLQAEPLPQTAPPARVCLAAVPIHSGDRFLYHKTTRREIYRQALAGRPGCDEVLLWNERGELTEATIANLFVEIDGALFTPPVECGLLPGTYRSWLLAEGRAAERVLRPDDLRRCTRVYLANAVRGIWPVQVDLQN